MNPEILRWLGFLGSLASGVNLIFTGQPDVGTGVILAGLSSASIIPKKQ